MESDLRARFDAIESKLKKLEQKQQEILESVESLSSDILGADQMSGASGKLDEILGILRDNGR